MGAGDAALDAVGTAALLIGTAASHPSMANVGRIISTIVKLAQTARRNKKECQRLAGRVRMLLGLLPCIQAPQGKAARAPLDGLVDALHEALELVQCCQNGSMIGRVFTTNLQAGRLADVQAKINFYLDVFPLVSHIATIAALDQIRIENAASRRPSEGITWAEVAAASSVTKVGKSAAGTVVYKATLQDGRQVAIKSFQTAEAAAFRSELAVLSGLRRHEHIVRLLCSWEEDGGGGKRLIVYEYVCNGTLRDNLRHGGEAASWRTRTEALLGAARAVEHLHCHAVVHGSVDSSNILLDASWRPRVSGFGAAAVDAAGSRTGRLAPAAGDDVRGFGVVMLEVLTGRETVVSVWKEEKKAEVDVTLQAFALPSIEAGKLEDVLDRRPASKPTPRQLKALNLVADMAARCVSPCPQGKEPTMSDVVANLEEARELICGDDSPE